MSTTVDILCFYNHLYDQLLKVKYASNLEHFQSLEVVCRGSETQLQVTVNLN